MTEKRDKAKELYNMKLGEEICFNTRSSWLRVPGGWVYGDVQGTTFIPFSDEFQKSNKFKPKFQEWCLIKYPEPQFTNPDEIEETPDPTKGMKYGNY